jgi:uncharacterized BrkB/YihY/UPF0761 family membrane protein
MTNRERWVMVGGLVAGIALAHIGWGVFILLVTLVNYELH